MPKEGRAGCHWPLKVRDVERRPALGSYELVLSGDHGHPPTKSKYAASGVTAWGASRPCEAYMLVVGDAKYWGEPSGRRISGTEPQGSPSGEWAVGLQGGEGIGQGPS